MADSKISALPASTTPLAGTEVLPIVQSSTTTQVSVANLTAGRAVSALTLASTTGATFATTSGSVGIGTLSPDANLTVNGAASFAAGTAALPSIARAGNLNTGMWFPAANTVAVSTGGSERLTVGSTGNVGIGISSANRTLSIYATTPLIQLINSTTGTTAADGLLIYQSGVNATLENGETGYMAFRTDAVERARIDSSGNLLVGVTSANANGGVLQLKSGITFPATAVAATDANTLDDYEEGTWTPVISGSTTAGTGTYSSQVGKYTKVGNCVFISADLGWSAHTGTGNINVTGLPFTSASGSANPIFVLTDGLTITGVPTVNVNSAASTMYAAALNNGATSLVAIDTSVGAFRFTGFYYV